MSELALYGSYASQPSASVVLFCRFSGINYEYKEIDMFSGGFMSEEFAKINPNQKLPAIDHNGFNLWESAAIVQYLADAYQVNNQWYPSDAKTRGKINAYLHWHHQNVRDPITGYIIAKFAMPRYTGVPISEDDEKRCASRLSQWTEDFKWLLSSTGYVARTSNLTIADIFAFCEVASAVNMLSFDPSSHPTIKAWYDQIATIHEVQEIGNLAGELVRKAHS